MRPHWLEHQDRLAFITGSNRGSLHGRLVTLIFGRRMEELTSRHHGFAGSRTRVELQAAEVVSESFLPCGWEDTDKVYFRCSSISIIAAWLPHL
jgi:membrane protein YqaA with SNARE-associated domain